MGTDIHSFAERRANGQWTRVPDVKPFHTRSHEMFEFLAGMRGTLVVEPISDRRGLPERIGRVSR